MAQKVQVLLVDDIDGGEADETVSFAVDGRAYEIDLNKQNAARLRDALAPFQEHARKAQPVGKKVAGRTPPNRGRSTEIRNWAKTRGIAVNDRGRIPQHVVRQYDAAH
ncbi:histone-like nucleoid-structuring protein Lsr2 [Actinomadura sp. 3N407]|uniref:histone-like nucleoid-structuring protein Lsr2 n=1 Tax=Actinomadura sp. 3N407 TaxID=3457423 RepID=UPI003FCDDDB3